MPYPQTFVSNSWNNASQDDLISYMEKQNHARNVFNASYRNYLSDLMRNGVKDASTGLTKHGFCLPEEHIPIKRFDTSLYVPYNLESVASSLARNTGFDQVGLYKMLLAYTLYATSGNWIIRCGSEWTEQALINIITTAPSGHRKSVISAFCQEPFNAFERNFNKTESCNEDFEDLPRTKQKIAQKMATKLTQKKLDSTLVNMGSTPSAEEFETLVNEIAEEEQRRIAPFRDQPPLQFFTDNVTVAGFHLVCSAQHGRLAIQSTEGGFLTRTSFLNGPLPELLKNSFSGEPFTQQNFRRSYRYARPFVALFILTQPEQLSRFLRKSSAFEGDGLWGRIVFHLAQSNKPNGEVSLSEARKRYSEVISPILQKEYNNQMRHQIALSNEAYSSVKEYESSLAKDCQNGTPFLKEAQKKAHGLACRFAFAFHLWNVAQGTSWLPTITSTEMQLGISLAEDCLEHYKFAIAPECLRAQIHARKLLNSLLGIDFFFRQEVLTHGISSRTLQQRTGLKADEVRNALALLQQCNLLSVLDFGGNQLVAALRSDFYQQPEINFS